MLEEMKHDGSTEKGDLGGDQEDRPGNRPEGNRQGNQEPWLTGWKFGGDIRLRYEGTYFDSDSTFQDRNRERMRLRFKVSKNIGWARVTEFFRSRLPGMGSIPLPPIKPSSTASTGSVWIDQAYLTWTPDIEGHFFTFGGGKFANSLGVFLMISTPT